MGRLSTGQYVALAITVPAAAALLYLLYKRKEEEQLQDIAIACQKIVEVKVPQEVVGSIIGRQGSNVKEVDNASDSVDSNVTRKKRKSTRVNFLEEDEIHYRGSFTDGSLFSYMYQIQNKSGARVNFRDETGFKEDEERVMIIRGKEECVQEAERLVREHIAKQPVIVTVEIPVPRRALGRIIGRNGDNIRSMCRISKARIKVNRSGDERDPNGQEIVTLKGSMEQIQNAKGLIEEKVAEEELFKQKLELASANRRPRSPKPSKERPSSANADSRPQRTAMRPAFNRFVVSDSALPTQCDHFEVYVSAVSTAGHFWLQVLGHKSQHLDYLIETMTEYYSDPDNREMEIPLSVDVGDIVSTPFKHDNDWYRSKVTSLEDDKVSVYYVDFGDDGVVDRDQVYKLRSDFLSLPFQAMECFLANVEPVGDGWTEKATDEFENLTYCAKWKVMMAKILSYKQTEKGLLPCVELVDTNGPQDVNINQKMVSLGHAAQSPRETPPSTCTNGSPKRSSFARNAKGRLGMKFPTDFETGQALGSFSSGYLSGKYPGRSRSSTGDIPSDNGAFREVYGAKRGSNGVRNGSGEPVTPDLTAEVECVKKDQDSQHATFNVSDSHHATFNVSDSSMSASTPLRERESDLSSVSDESQASPIYPTMSSGAKLGDEGHAGDLHASYEDSSSVGLLEITSSTAESSEVSMDASMTGSCHSDQVTSMQDSSYEPLSQSRDTSTSYDDSADRSHSAAFHESSVTSDTSRMSESLLLADVSSSESSCMSSASQKTFDLVQTLSEPEKTAAEEPREISPVSEDSASFKSAVSVEASSPSTDPSSLDDSSSFASMVSMETAEKSAFSHVGSTDTPNTSPDTSPDTSLDTSLSPGDPNSSLPTSSDLDNTLATTADSADLHQTDPDLETTPAPELDSYSVLPDSKSSDAKQRRIANETYSLSSTDRESYSTSSESDVGAKKPASATGTDFGVSSDHEASYSTLSGSHLDDTRATTTTSGSYSISEGSSSEATNSDALSASLDLSTHLLGTEVFSPEDKSLPDDDLNEIPFIPEEESASIGKKHGGHGDGEKTENQEESDSDKSSPAPSSAESESESEEEEEEEEKEDN